MQLLRQCTEEPGAPHVKKGGNLWEPGPPIDGAWRALNIFHRTAGLPASTYGRWVDGGIGLITSVFTLKHTSSSVNRDPGMCFLPRILACLENKKKNWPTDAIVLNYHTNPETQFWASLFWVSPQFTKIYPLSTSINQFFSLFYLNLPPVYLISSPLT